MQIQLNNIQFTELDYKVANFDKSITHELNTSLGLGSLFFENDERSFAIVFNVLLEDNSKKFKLQLKAVAHFLVQDDIDDDFKKSAFIQVNAPAIAFPYIRTFISNLTLNSGYDPSSIASI
jgi:preprotein translocase subunit SecB